METRKKPYSEQEMMQIHKDATRLPAELVERGVVLCAPIRSDWKTSVVKLFLEPRAKIKMHKHEAEREEYLFLKPESRPVEICNPGDSHELENNTGDWMEVWATKTKVRL